MSNRKERAYLNSLSEDRGDAQGQKGQSRKVEGDHDANYRGQDKTTTTTEEEVKKGRGDKTMIVLLLFWVVWTTGASIGNSFENDWHSIVDVAFQQ